MSALFLELDRTVLIISSPLASHEEVAKALPVVRLATKKLLVSVVNLELLATTLGDKHMATVLPNCVLFRRVTDITGVNHLFLLCLVPQKYCKADTWPSSQIRFETLKL